MKLEFSRLFFKSQISNFMKIRPLGAEVNADGKTHRHDEAKSSFVQFFLDSPSNLSVFVIRLPKTLNGIPKFVSADLDFSSWPMAVYFACSIS